MSKPLLKRISILILLILLISFQIWPGITNPKIANAQPSTPETTFWGVNGEIHTILTDGTKAYIGGNFNYIGPNTGTGVPINKTTGQLASNFPKFNGEIKAAVSDGSGGWYVGGNFDKIDGNSHLYLAHILSDGSIDTFWNPELNGLVNSLARSDNILYVGGEFTQIGSQTRNHLAAFDLTTGNLTSWNPNVNGLVFTIVATNTTVYIGGSFTSVGGVTRNRVAAINVSTGDPTNWDPNADDSVYTLALNTGDGMFVGGTFRNIGGAHRNYVAKVDLDRGAALAWDPNPNNNVYSLTIDDSLSVIYIGGDFTTIDSKSRNYLAAAALDDGKVTNWNPNPDGTVTTLLLERETLYLGGWFNSIGSQNRYYLGAVNTNDGNPTSWNPSASYYVNTLAFNSDRSYIFVGGNFFLAGGVFRSNLAEIDLTTGQPTSWHADADGTVYALAFNADKSIIYVGGSFTSINSIPRNYLAAIDRSTGIVTSWHPQVDGFVRTIAYSANGSIVYIGGNFDNVGGESRSHLAGVEAISGNVTSFNPTILYPVHAITINKQATILYAGDYIVSCRGFPPICSYAGNIYAFNLTDGSPLFGAIQANAGINSLSLSENEETLFIGGRFSSLNFGLTMRNHLAAINAQTGEVTAWNPDSDGEIFGLLADSGNVYVGGSFTTVGSNPRNNAASVSATTGETFSWNPNFDSTVFAFAVNKTANKLLVGGSFSEVNGKMNYGFAVFALPVVEFLNTSGSGPNTLTWPTVTVQLSQTSTENVTVDYKVTGGTAIRGVDYELSDGTSTISAGTLNANIPLKIITPQTYQPAKTIIITLSNAKGATLGNNTSFTYTITAGEGVNAGGGGLPAQAFSPPTPPEGGFKVLINNDANETSLLDVTLSLYGGPDTERMAISNYPDFNGAIQEPYQTSKNWTLAPGAGLKTVYVKFYTKWGQPSEVVSDSITYVSRETVQQTYSTTSQQEETPQEETAPQIAPQIPDILKACVFDTNLRYGNIGNKVRCLQHFLAWMGKEIYPEGIVSGWFGPLTFKAVIRFQEKYADEILKPLGLTKGTGFVGPATRAKINKILEK